jgi:hypothetical protein
MRCAGSRHRWTKRVLGRWTVCLNGLFIGPGIMSSVGLGSGCRVILLSARPLIANGASNERTMATPHSMHHRPSSIAPSGYRSSHRRRSTSPPPACTTTSTTHSGGSSWTNSGSAESANRARGEAQSEHDPRVESQPQGLAISRGTGWAPRPPPLSSWTTWRSPRSERPTRLCHQAMGASVRIG